MAPGRGRQRGRRLPPGRPDYGRTVGFPAARIGQLALAVTEAASNLHKHAEQGSLLLWVNRDGPQPGVDLVTIDAGRACGT